MLERVIRLIFIIRGLTEINQSLMSMFELSDVSLLFVILEENLISWVQSLLDSQNIIFMVIFYGNILACIENNSMFLHGEIFFLSNTSV